MAAEGRKVNTTVTIAGDTTVGSTLTAVVTDLSSSRTISGYEWSYGDKTVTTETPELTLTQEIYDAGVISVKVLTNPSSSRLTAMMYIHFDSGIPVLFINTEGGRSIMSKDRYINASMKIQLTDATAQYTNMYTDGYAPIEIRGRGNSTWWQEKKPYHIKLDKKTDLFGMGENKHWVLLANAMEGSHLRNVLSYGFSGLLGLDYCQSIHVQVILNGEYVGLYQLCENIRIDESRVDIFDWEDTAEDVAKAIAKAENLSEDDLKSLEEGMKTDFSWVTSGKFKKYTISDYYDTSSFDITGGYVLELDEYFDEVSKFITDHDDIPIMIHNPEYLATNDKMFGYVRDYIQNMEDALYDRNGYSSEGKHWSEYLDTKSFIDYWISNQAFKSVEILYKSAYMYKDVGGKLIFGPVWDMDWASGNHANLGDGDAAQYNTWTQEHSQDREYWYKAVYDDPWFMTSVADRWWEARVKLQETIDTIDGLYELLAPEAEKNIERWGKIGRWSYEKEVAELKKWLINRMAWMDEQLAKRDPNIWGRGYDLVRGLKIELVDGGNTVLTAPESNLVSADGIEYKTPADLYYGGSGTLTMNLSLTTDMVKYFDVYINGLKYATCEASGAKGTLEIDTADLMPISDCRRNVIRVVARSELGDIGENFVTLYVAGAPTRTFSYASGAGDAEGADPRTVEYTEGSSFNLPWNPYTREGYAFKGWSDGDKVYAAGASYTAGGSDVTFTAVWQPEGASAGGGGAVIAIICGAVILVAAAAAVVIIRKRKK